MASIVGDVWYSPVLGYGQSGDDGLGSPVCGGRHHCLASEEEVEPLPAVAISRSRPTSCCCNKWREGSYAASSFESGGLFTAILTALLATKLYAVLLKRM